MMTFHRSISFQRFQRNKRRKEIKICGNNHDGFKRFMKSIFVLLVKIMITKFTMKKNASHTHTHVSGPLSIGGEGNAKKNIDQNDEKKVQFEKNKQTTTNVATEKRIRMKNKNKSMQSIITVIIIKKLVPEKKKFTTTIHQIHHIIIVTIEKMKVIK